MIDVYAVVSVAREVYSPTHRANIQPRPERCLTTFSTGFFATLSELPLRNIAGPKMML
jgi:hypothetical protein